MPGKLIVVDDDRFILNALVRLLNIQGYHCTTAVTADEAWRILEKGEFDLAILDVGLPDMDGISLCRRIRAHSKMPIIMLTARDAAADKVVGLEVGADDYITKPFDPLEVIARVRAQLRRHQEYNSESRPSEVIQMGNLILNVDEREARLNNYPTNLTDKEFELIHLMARNRGRALSKDWIFEQVWGYDAELGAKALAVYIRRLRCKVEEDPDNPKCILTVRGFGYKIASSEELRAR